MIPGLQRTALREVSSLRLNMQTVCSRRGRLLKGADNLFHVKHVVCTSAKPNCHVSARGMYVSISGHGASLFVAPRETVNGRSALCLMFSPSLLTPER